MPCRGLLSCIQHLPHYSDRVLGRIMGHTSCDRDRHIVVPDDVKSVVCLNNNVSYNVTNHHVSQNPSFELNHSFRHICM